MAFDARTTFISFDSAAPEICNHGNDKLLCMEIDCLRSELTAQRQITCVDCTKTLIVRDAWHGYSDYAIDIKTLRVSCCKTRECKICKIPFRLTKRHPKKKFCSRDCYRVFARNQQGKNYKRIRVNGKRIYLHRYVWEQATGEVLTDGDIIHHKDENKFNNDISNLEKLSGRAAHLHKHNYHKKGTAIIDDCPF